MIKFKQRRMLIMGWLLGSVMDAAGNMAMQDSHGGLEGYITHLRNGHWLNTPWWLWAGVWCIGLVIFLLIFFKKE